MAWTPDQRIVYSADTKDSTTLWIMNADGSKQKQLIPSGGVNSYPSLTSDGRLVVFQSNRGGHFGVWRADLNGENMMPLTGDTAGGWPSVSPDGKWIIYNSNINSDGELWRLSTAGGEPVRLVDKPARWAIVSLDSKMVACSFDGDGRTKLVILSLDDGRLVRSFDISRLANLRLGFHWTPDGKAVTYLDRTNGIWRQDLSGGEPQRLKGLPEEKLFSYAWSPDGKWFAYTRGSTTRDVVLISNAK